MLHRLCGPPSIPLSFTLASILPRRDTYRVSYDTAYHKYTTSSIHRLQLRLPGYLILFAPLAFVSECQYWPSKVPSQLVFFPISTHFTAPPEIPFTSTILKIYSFFCRFWVKPKDLTTDLNIHLQTLYAQ